MVKSVYKVEFGPPVSKHCLPMQVKNVFYTL